MSTSDERLHTESNIWLATVRANGKPHLTPIWFVYVEQAVWVCTCLSAVKSQNMQHDHRVSFALQDGNAPVTGEGKATLMTQTPANVHVEFQRKYDWDINRDDDHQALFCITIDKWLSPGNDSST